MFGFRKKKNEDAGLFDLGSIETYGFGDDSDIDDAIDRMRIEGQKRKGPEESPPEPDEAPLPPLSGEEDGQEEGPAFREESPGPPPPAPEPRAPEGDDELFPLFAPADDALSAAVRPAPENFWEQGESPGRFGTPRRALGRALLLLLALAGLAAAAFYVREAGRYRSVFLPGTVVNGTDVSGLTPEAAADVFREDLKSRQVELIDRTGGSTVVQASGIGMEFGKEDRLREMLSGQNPWAWPVAELSLSSESVEDAYEIDRSVLDRYLAALPVVSGKDVKPPADAQISYDPGEKAYKAVPADEGTTLDREALGDAVAEALTLGRRKIDLDSAGLYEEPEKRADDPVFEASLESLNAAAEASVSYETEDGNGPVLDITVFHNWLSADKDGNLVVDEAKAKTYAEDLADDLDTEGRTIPFRTTGSGTIRVPAGGGTKVDTDAEAERIVSDIRGGAPVAREPEYASRPVSGAASAGSVGSTYIEVSLSKQRMWFYKNGVETADAEIVSGARGSATPTGLFAVSDIREGGALSADSADAEAADESVPAVRLDNGYWIYEAPWRDAFGPGERDEDGTPGSVAVPEGALSKVVSGAQEMTPVIVY